MELKDVLGEIESDGANLVHGRLLEWALTPPLWHAEAVGGVHTIRADQGPARERFHHGSEAGSCRCGLGPAWHWPVTAIFPLTCLATGTLSTPRRSKDHGGRPARGVDPRPRGDGGLLRCLSGRRLHPGRHVLRRRPR